MNIAIKHTRKSLKSFEKFRISGKNLCNKAKQISTGFEIEIEFKILHSVGEIKTLFA